MSDPGPIAQAFGRVAYEFALVQPMLPTYFHLLVSAVFPIYAGAHASLSPPSSAAKPDKKNKKSATDEDDEEDEEEEYQRMEGLSPRDALMFPLMAGTTLAGLYFLLKWLKDPALLNKILNGYFAIFGVFSVSRLVTDALDIGHSLIFPKRYALGGTLYQVSNVDKTAKPVFGNGKASDVVHSPLPGFLSRIPLPLRVRNVLWTDRAMPSNKWIIRMYIHRIVAAKMKIGSHGVAGAVIALAAVTYFNFVDKPWYLTNLMGFGFSYGALQLMSPTTFATGSLILGALFVYDIYFVFFTPMMVTVATSLDVPIKLMFPRPSSPSADPAIRSHAMLGLGDVVLPGIMIGLALRYDLYLFYLRKQTQSAPALDLGDGVKPTIVKEKYFSLSGRWSEHFWTHTWTGRPLFSFLLASQQPHFTFPKTYFNASLVGYVVGMLTTLGVMQIYGHAQPALLYLVPGVLVSIWGTALVRGELKEMWDYSEAIDEEEEDERQGNGEGSSVREQHRPSFFSLESHQRQADKLEKAFNRHIKNGEDSDWEDAGREESSSDRSDNKSNDSLSHPQTLPQEDVVQDIHKKTKKITARNKDRELLSFSIEAPWTLSSPQSIAKPEKASSEPEKHANATTIEIQDPSSNLSGLSTGTDLGKEKPNWKTLERQTTDGEHAGKRLRTA
ncbi:uncharacterized protein BDZ99DRAFT_462948 [Mytilinidion resinicola]|uniref:Intramembrane protease 2 n=1 Tax=Mytilinidion resinicola TaxID=574789 RepID=A0A6A6YNC4_9PEZI|nr:uncharacterized protein BDZ99DRAFT_462948 [Mytilinidion resinicola]KAF2810372.1 hypothetical protein BDZ99DRAFT_462948 [Mytilinidion resinicola]